MPLYYSPAAGPFLRVVCGLMCQVLDDGCVNYKLRSLYLTSSSLIVLSELLSTENSKQFRNGLFILIKSTHLVCEYVGVSD